MEAQIRQTKQATLQEVDLIRRKSLSSDQFDRSRDELNARIDTVRKTV